MRDDGTIRTPATGETGVGWGGAGRGAFAGSGAGVTGAVAHASVVLVARIADSRTDIAFCFIIES